VNTYEWYKQRIYELDGSIPDSFEQATALAREREDRIPIGIFYMKKKIDFTNRIPALESGTLLSRPYDPDAVQALFELI
jgi:hypothetical protein